jgi:hypothetical protein
MSIKGNLRALSTREVTIEELDEYQRQVENETNDRGSCILTATNVELALDAALFKVLDRQVRDDLIRQDGPISSFSQKITLGRALNIYGEQTRHNLDLIRQIRNAFAHSHAPITFETRQVKDAVGELREIRPLPPVASPKHPGVVAERTSRTSFQLACTVTAHNLIVWAYHDRIFKPLDGVAPIPERKSLP